MSDNKNEPAKNLSMLNIMEKIRFKNFQGNDKFNKPIKSFKAIVDILEFNKDEIKENIFNKETLNNFCEWTDYSDKIKPFYDLDLKYYGASGEITYQTDKDRVKDEFKYECNKLFPDSEIIISSSHGKKLDNKGVECLAISYHFVINNYETTIEELREFNEWNNIYKNFKVLGVDKSVYRDGGNMRAILSNKPFDDRKKIPVNSRRNLYKHLITSNSYTNKEFKKINIVNKSPAVSPPISPRVETILEKKQEEIKLPKCDKETFIKHMKSFKPRYEYVDWLDIGYICYNNFDGSNIGLEIWNNYSKNDAKKYDLKFILKQWVVFEKQYDKTKKKLSYKRLIKYYDEDYPCKNKYEKFYKEGRLIEEMNKECIFYTATSDIIYFVDEKNYIIGNCKSVELIYKKYTFEIEIEIEGKNKKQKINPFKLWLENIDRRDINEIVFDPSTLEQKENIFNTWTGFEYSNTTQYDNEKIKDFLFHIKDVLADGDEIQYEYILNWIAHMFQKPWKRTNSCLVFKSIQGTGKTIIMDILGEMIGKNSYLATNSLDAVLGHFTSSGANKLLVNFNETNWGGDVKMEGKFKSFITDDVYKVEKKGKDPYYIKNLANSIITSNKDWLIAMTKDDRRFNVMECKNEKLSKEKALKILETDLQHLFNFFYNRNIEQFDPTIFKRSSFAQEQIEMNYDSVQIFWKNFIDGETQLVKEKFMDKKEMYDVYILETVASHSNKVNNVNFWKKIRKLSPSIKFHKANIKNGGRIEISNDDILIQEFENANY